MAAERTISAAIAAIIHLLLTTSSRSLYSVSLELATGEYVWVWLEPVNGGVASHLLVYIPQCMQQPQHDNLPVICFHHTIGLLHTWDISALITVVSVSPRCLSKHPTQTNTKGPPLPLPRALHCQRCMCCFVYLSTYSYSFVGAVVTSLVGGLDHDSAIKVGLRAAFASLRSPRAVSEELNSSFLDEKSINTWAPWKSSHVF